MAGRGLGVGQGGVEVWCSRCCWCVWLVAVLETVAQVEAAELVGTAPRQGVTMVEAAALEERSRAGSGSGDSSND